MNQNSAINNQINVANAHSLLEPVMRPVSNNDVLRSTLENFISSSYETIFNAKLKCFLPNLVASTFANDNISSAFGYSDAAQERLFLESYIDEPIEILLSKKLNRKIPRSKIVEVGNLSITRAADSVKTMHAIAGYLLSLGYEWIICTATRYLRLLFLRSGAKPVTIAAASHARVDNNGTDWGNYYSTKAEILVGNVEQSITLIENRIISNQYTSHKKAKLINLNEQMQCNSF